MNPKSVNDLDPKLKETYERVMGTSLGGDSAPPPAMETQPVSQPSEPKPEPQAQPEPQPGESAPIEGSTVSQVFRADNTTKPTETAVVNPPSENQKAAKKGGKKLLPVIIVVGAVIFFAIYAVLWAKLLGLF
ncbi:MAG: hypothetical protein ABSD69_02685 [Candidatus Levyibacteriota bacterium]|jgi:hypothetical protein